MKLQNLQQENDNIINDQNNGQYGEGNENDSTIKLRQKLLNQIFAITQMLIFL